MEKMNKIKVRTIKELDPLQVLSLTDFSYSRIDTYKMCPSKYFYSYVQKEPRTFNDAAVLGNIVHSVLEECLDNDKQMDVNELQGEYVKQISSYDPTGIIPDNLIQVGSEILDEFYDKHSGDTFNIYDKEFGFSFVLGNYLINGYIDRIDFYDEDTINIIDYKTRKMGSYSKGSSKQSSAWHIRLSSINSFSG
jgi:ATP-dependent helicase/DNAse subunit B